MINDVSEVGVAIGSYLDFKKIKYTTPDKINAIFLGLSGKVYKYDLVFIYSKRFVTVQARLPFSIVDGKYEKILKLANKFSIQDPICSVEVLSESGPISVKAGIRLNDKIPSNEMIDAIMVSAYAMAELCAQEFLEIINS
jgi:hypothetical protein